MKLFAVGILERSAASSLLSGGLSKRIVWGILIFAHASVERVPGHGSLGAEGESENA
jgi:hypothetical protein